MNLGVTEKVQCEILVAGTGGAGIRAALTAALEGKDVLLTGHTSVGKSGSTFYPLSSEWGMLTAKDDEDGEQFYREILDASGGCIRKPLAKMLAKNSKRAYERMVQEGLEFVTMEEVEITGCFGKAPRGVFLKNMDNAISSFKLQLGSMSNIRIWENLCIVSLVVVQHRCCGALAVDRKGNLIHICAGAVILACGGGEGLYEYGASYGQLLGGAYAMAARHGARLTNLEFIQFVHGSVAPIRGINYYPFALRELPQIRNGRGEACLERYLPEGCREEECILERSSHGPFSTKGLGKYLDYGMVGEYERGNGLGLSVIPDRKRLQGNRYRLWRDFLNRLGYNEGTQMTLYPFCQGFNGGILLHDDITTDIPGLFACGESAGGCHGPDRMGGLCILATQVFGEAAATAAVAYLGNHGCVAPDGLDIGEILLQEFERKGEQGDGPEQVLQKIRRIMQTYGVFHRNEEGLKKALSQLEQVSVEPLKTLGSPQAFSYFQICNALDAAKLILTSMLIRRESRGGHDRSDFPGRDPGQQEMNWITMKEGRVQSGRLQDSFEPGKG